MAAELSGEIRAGDAETRAYVDERVGASVAVGRGNGLEGRVLRLEARVLSLEDDRKPRRPRRQR
jgi:hypothetical protein